MAAGQVMATGVRRCASYGGLSVLEPCAHTWPRTVTVVRRGLLWFVLRNMSTVSVSVRARACKPASDEWHSQRANWQPCSTWTRTRGAWQGTTAELDLGRHAPMTVLTGYVELERAYRVAFTILAEELAWRSWLA